MDRINTDGLAFSTGYADTMAQVVLPYISARRTDLKVQGDGGCGLFVSRFDADQPRGTVLIVHGFTENADKFSEVIHSLLKNGLSVVAYDQRGHGRSWRDPSISDHTLTHVEEFYAYVRDMKIVYDQVVSPMPKPHRVFCHSMGGAVTALFLEDHPGLMDRAAMCAPMIAPNLGGLPVPIAKLMCIFKQMSGNGKARIPGSKPYAGAEAFEPSCATGRARFDWYEALRVATPAFQNNGPSYSWTLEAINVTYRILAPRAVEKIDAKVRLYTASLDNTVLPEPQARFISRVPNGRHEVVEGAKHEIYRSDDDVLFPWWHGVLGFLTGAED